MNFASHLPTRNELYLQSWMALVFFLQISGSTSNFSWIKYLNFQERTSYFVRVGTKWWSKIFDYRSIFVFHSNFYKNVHIVQVARTDFDFEQGCYHYSQQSSKIAKSVQRNSITMPCLCLSAFVHMFMFTKKTTKQRLCIRLKTPTIFNISTITITKTFY